MKNLTLFSTLLFVVLGCVSESKKSENKAPNSEPNKVNREVDIINDSILEVKNKRQFTHLRDTIIISGKTILILRPDSLRFYSYIDAGEEWIYEVDSDFGFGFSKALDSINFKGVNEEITEKRFIKILDCKACPIIFDRDTIDYGFILTKPNENPRISNVVLGYEIYMQEFENYFKRY